MANSMFGQYRFSFRSTGIALLISVMLMLTDYQHPEWFTRPKNVVHQVHAALGNVSRYPVMLSSWLGQQLRFTNDVRRENIALKAQLLQNQFRLQQLAELTAENARLKGILQSPILSDSRLLIAQIIAADVDPRRHIIMVDKGKKDGVYVGQPVFDDQGVMGQVVEVYPNAARIMLISDKDHAIAVRIERTGMRGIAAGMGDSSRIDLQYIPNTADVQLGDKVVSSGLGAIFPAGYPVGVVKRINRPASNEFANIEVQPVSRLDSVQQVILLFSTAHAYPSVAGHDTVDLALQSLEQTPVVANSSIGLPNAANYFQKKQTQQMSALPAAVSAQ